MHRLRKESEVVIFHEYYYFPEVVNMWKLLCQGAASKTEQMYVVALP